MPQQEKNFNTYICGRDFVTLVFEAILGVAGKSPAIVPVMIDVAVVAPVVVVMVMAAADEEAAAAREHKDGADR